MNVTLHDLFWILPLLKAFLVKKPILSECARHHYNLSLHTSGAKRYPFRHSRPWVLVCKVPTNPTEYCNAYIGSLCTWALAGKPRLYTSTVVTYGSHPRHGLFRLPADQCNVIVWSATNPVIILQSMSAVFIRQPPRPFSLIPSSILRLFQYSICSNTKWTCFPSTSSTSAIICSTWLQKLQNLSFGAPVVTSSCRWALLSLGLASRVLVGLIISFHSRARGERLPGR